MGSRHFKGKDQLENREHKTAYYKYYLFFAFNFFYKEFCEAPSYV